MGGMAKKDYYKVLGVGRDASESAIRSAYRKLARTYHPDVNKEPDASEKFREATEAYEVLSDPQKRKAYDRFGHAGVGQEAAAGAGAWGAGPQWYRAGGRRTGGEGVEFDMSDLFGRGARGGRTGGGFMGMSLEEILDRLSGGRARAGRAARGPRARPSGQDVEQTVRLDFMQAVYGTTLSVRAPAGPGQAGETIRVKIPAGVRDGARIRVRGKGAPGPGGRGDLYIIPRIGPHPYFRREGDDVHVEVPITITEAALGAKVDVPAIDGMTTVTVPPGTPSSLRLRLRGKGIQSPGRSTRGDQYVTLRIVPPRELSDKGRALLERFRAEQPYNPRDNAPWTKG